MELISIHDVDALVNVTLAVGGVIVACAIVAIRYLITIARNGERRIEEHEQKCTKFREDLKQALYARMDRGEKRFRRVELAIMQIQTKLGVSKPVDMTDENGEK